MCKNRLIGKYRLITYEYKGFDLRSFTGKFNVREKEDHFIFGSKNSMMDDYFHEFNNGVTSKYIIKKCIIGRIGGGGWTVWELISNLFNAITQKNIATPRFVISTL